MHRSILLSLALIGGAFAAIPQVSNAQIDLSPDVAGPVVAGGYRGLLTGTSGPGDIDGELAAHVRKNGEFTGALSLEGKRFPLLGKFTAGAYSTTIHDAGKPVGVSIAFTGTGSLTGVVTDGSQTLDYSGGPITDTSSAGGRYRFIISPGQVLSSGSAPEGTGYGDMYVRTRGTVSLLGRLPDGTYFSAESSITSGSSVPVYVHMGRSPYTGFAGTLYFQDVPNVSDCSGTTYWAKAAKADSHYPDGFETTAQFVACGYNRVIGGLDRDVATFTASGSDLQANVTADITLTPQGNLYRGAADKVHLTLRRSEDIFFGSFEDTTTQLRHPFAGVLLPKSRTGAGIFFSEGLSGTVTIQY